MLLKLLVYAVALAALVLLGWLTDRLSAPAGDAFRRGTGTGRGHDRRETDERHWTR